MNICNNLLPFFLLYAVSLLNISLTDSENRDMELRRDQSSKTGHDKKDPPGRNDPKSNVPKCQRIKCLNSRTCENLVRKNRKCRYKFCNSGKCSLEKPQSKEPTVGSGEHDSGNDKPKHNGKFRRFTRVARQYTHWNSRPAETRSPKFAKCATTQFRSRACRRSKRGIKSCLAQLRRNCHVNRFPQRYKGEVNEEPKNGGVFELSIQRNPGKLVFLTYQPKAGNTVIEISERDVYLRLAGYRGKGVRRMMVEALEDRVRAKYPHVQLITVRVKNGEPVKRWKGYGFDVATTGGDGQYTMGAAEGETVLVKTLDRRL